MTLQTIIALLFLLLPLVASLLEQKKRKEKAEDAMREVERRQAGPSKKASPAPARETPAPSQSLADWIEEVKRRGDQGPESVTTAPPEPRRAGRPVLAERDLIETLEEPAPRTRTKVRPEAEVEVVAMPDAESTLAADKKRSRVREEVAGSAYSRRSRPEHSADAVEASETADGARSATRARRESDRGRGFALNLRHRDLARALVLREVLGPPLALREEDEDPTR